MSKTSPLTQTKTAEEIRRLEDQITGIEHFTNSSVYVSEKRMRQLHALRGRLQRLYEQKEAGDR